MPPRGGNDGNNLSSHILPVAATMVGVCMTVIGLVKVLEATSRAALAIDEMLALDNLLFLLSAILSYGSIRSPQHAERLERIADIAFMVGLVILTIIGILFGFEFA
jgi:hypothetical protein